MAYRSAHLTGEALAAAQCEQAERVILGIATCLNVIFQPLLYQYGSDFRFLRSG
jgi:hypothetical protein